MSEVTIAEMLRRFEKVNIEQMTGEAMIAYNEDIAKMNRSQLLEGKNKDGEFLPRYVDDPFFKTRAQAEGYERWKEKISPNKGKPKGVMDFYINGYYHNNIELKVNGSFYQLYNDADFDGSVARKTGDKALGLTSENKRKAWFEFLQSDVVKKIKALTGAS